MNKRDENEEDDSPQNRKANSDPIVSKKKEPIKNELKLKNRDLLDQFYRKYPETPNPSEMTSASDISKDSLLPNSQIASLVTLGLENEDHNVDHKHKFIDISNAREKENFEPVILKVSDIRKEAEVRITKKETKNKEPELEREIAEKIKSKNANILKYCVFAIGIINFIKKVNESFIVVIDLVQTEHLVVEGVYNCPDSIFDGEQAIAFLNIIHVLTSLLLIFSLTKEMSAMCIVWIASQTIDCALFVLQCVYKFRFHENDPDLKDMLILLFLILFDTICVVIVMAYYYKVKKPHNERRRRLKSKRVLNREIDAMNISPFLQRKMALRWASRFQTMLVLHKMKGKRKDGSGYGTPSEKDTVFNIEEGLKAYDAYMNTEFEQD